MKIFTDCSGECCICCCGDFGLAGHGDDDFSLATKEQVIKRLNRGSYPGYRQMMIDYLKKFGIDYPVGLV